MPWFAERFSGWIIRFGAERRPDPYDWSLPLSDDGEFAGVSRTPQPPLLISLVREAKAVGRILLNGKEPFWYSAPTVPGESQGVSTQEKRMKMTVTITVENDPSEASHFHEISYQGANISLASAQALTKGIVGSMFAYGDAELAPTTATAKAA